ncbi:MAG: serine/threonine-protein kinase [Actinomycetota bacterium]
MTRTKHHIGRYRIIAPIGAGGFSTVYRGLDEERHREVAIKVLAENHSLVPDTRRRFMDEYKLRATVTSPYIARIYEVGETETGQPFMVLELADRGDLRRRVEEIRQAHQVLTRDDLVTLAQHLTESLTALHDADIVHRDVSPGNILIRSRPSSRARNGAPSQGPVHLLEPGERLLLADLGHAKDLVKASGFTAGGGTQGFAAPEQRDDVTVVDHRADIFSATAIIEWAAHDGFYAEGLEPFFDIGLAAEPDERYPNMADWYESIGAALDAVDGEGSRKRFRRPRGRGRAVAKPAVPAPGPAPILDEAPEPPVRSKRWAVITAAMAAITAVVLVGLTALDLGLADDTEATETAPSTTEVTVAGTASTEAPTSTGPLVVQAPGEDGALPYAAIDEPMEGDVVDGDLVITGGVFHDGGVERVELTVLHLGTDTYWTPDDPAAREAERFDAELSITDDDPTSGTYRIELPDADLEAGDYLIQVWARGPDGESPAEPTSRQITIS